MTSTTLATAALLLPLLPMPSVKTTLAAALGSKLPPGKVNLGMSLLAAIGQKGYPPPAMTAPSPDCHIQGWSLGSGSCHCGAAGGLGSAKAPPLDPDSKACAALARARAASARSLAIVRSLLLPHHATLEGSHKGSDQNGCEDWVA